MDKRTALRTLRDLQGKTASPIVVLLAMYIQQLPVTKKFLAAALDTSYNTISRIVDRLEHDGYVLRDGYRRWILPGGQLPLPGFDLESSPSSSIPSTSSSISQYPRLPARTKTGDVSAETGPIDAPGAPICTPADEICISDADVVKNGPQNPETSNFDVSGPTTTTCTSTMHEKEVVVGRVEPPETSKFDVSGPPPSSCPEDLAAAFRDAGLGQNIWPELAAYPWVSPRYVRAMAARIRAHPDPARRNTGFLIHCIRSGDPEPDWCEDCDALGGDHRPGCPRYVAPHMRYIAGKYADRVDH